MLVTVPRNHRSLSIVTVILLASGVGCTDSTDSRLDNVPSEDAAVADTRPDSAADTTPSDTPPSKDTAADTTRDTHADVPPSDTPGDTPGDTSTNGPTLDWVELIDGPRVDEITDVEIGTNGSIYVAGAVSGSVGGESYGGGDSDAFFAKFLPDGTRSWIELFGDEGEEAASGIVSPPFAGVVGTWHADLEDGQATDLHLTELDRGSGDEQSDVALEKTDTDIVAHALLALNANRMLVTGQADAEAFGEDVGEGPDAFLAEIRRGSGREWIQFQGTDGRDIGLGLIRASNDLDTDFLWLVAEQVDRSGDATLALDRASESTSPSRVGELRKTPFDARHTWSFGLVPSPSGPLAHGTAAPPGGDALASDAFAAAYNQSGVEQFSTTWGGDRIDLAADAATGDDSTWVTGTLGFSFGDGVPAAEGFLRRIDGQGALLSSTAFGTNNDVLPHAVARYDDADQPIYVGGSTLGDIDGVGPGQGQQSAGFLVRFVPEATN